MSDIASFIVSIVEEQAKKVKASDWENSIYKPLRDLGSDRTGQVGEDICVRLLKEAGHRVEYGRGVTEDEKDYDFVCDGLRIEVKLATRGGTNPTFQHENLIKTRHFDGLVCIDVAPDKVYLYCAAKKDLPWKNGMTQRDSGVYKYDLRVKKHEEEGNEIKTKADFLKKYRAMDARIRRLRAQSPKGK